MSTMETNTTYTEPRYKGRVKFFNSTKGYGFILSDSEQNEVFVHHTAIQNNGGFKSLAEGEQVEYDLVQGPKGMQASNVTGPNGSPVQGDPRTQQRSSQYSDCSNRISYYGGTLRIIKMTFFFCHVS
ncbi:cold-shock' DNA-binding domain-containing protein [Pilaira anomala]|nr:cold-shock' DNA-binding domain-containing protein [Pilaira anomala]